MTAAWPETLPQLLQLDGSSIGMADGRLRSQTDTGPGKVRLRSSAMVMPFSGTLIMDSDQLTTLDSFLGPAGDTAGGALPFTFPAVYGGGTWLVRVADSMPSRQALGGDAWQVTLALEKLP